jgi:hypothetical protein
MRVGSSPAQSPEHTPFLGRQGQVGPAETEETNVIRRLILSAAAGAAAIVGLSLTPSSAEAAPRCEPVIVHRPVFHHPHHHAGFGVRVAVPAPIVVARPVCTPPAPVVVVPAPVVRPVVVCPR